MRDTSVIRMNRPQKEPLSIYRLLGLYVKSSEFKLTKKDFYYYASFSLKNYILLSGFTLGQAYINRPA